MGRRNGARQKASYPRCLGCRRLVGFEFLSAAMLCMVCRASGPEPVPDSAIMEAPQVGLQSGGQS
jgi:hypothetical protein